MSVKLTLCVMAGIVLGFYGGLPPLSFLIVLLVLLPVLYGIGKKQTRDGFPFFELFTAFFGIGLGVFVVGMATFPVNSYRIDHDLNLESTWHLKITERLKPNPFSQKYVAEVIALDTESASGKILLILPSDSTDKSFKVDDELLILAKPETVPPPLNPHQFDYKRYLEKQGIHHQILANKKVLVPIEHPSQTLLGVASSFREHIIAQLKKHDFGVQEVGVIQALLLGQRDDISEDTYNNYINAGAVHILAVSGLHVGILLLLLQFLLSPLERLRSGKTLKLVIIVTLLWAYAFIAGLSPSIIRAVTMFSFLAYAMHLNRPTNSFNIIALSMLFILLVKPLFLFQVGFQMSYAAVFAIVWIYPKMQRFWYPDNYFLQKIWQLLSVSVAAQLGVLPISLFYFHQFPALFFVANLLIIPFLGLILGFGILVIFLALMDALPATLVLVYDQIIKLMNATVGWVAHQEEFIFKDIPFDAVQLVLGYVVVFALVVFLSRPKWKLAMILLLGFIGFQGWNLWNQVQIQKKETLILTHRSRNTVLLHQMGSSLQIYAADSLNLGSLTKDYSIAERVKNSRVEPLKNYYSINQQTLYVMGSLALYPPTSKIDYLLLTQSPKVNLERVLDSLRPKMVLADGSNYKSVVKRWEKTCKQKEIPFHYTGEKGFYVFIVEED
ncbi:ComEC/Rec2 family competence protein [Flagellimonas aequoris]|uniref:ComEC family competence protein n=1 Tax=Flagellimonas aequoris TaxID=2306997 RepID=A0A418N842_9FLAO|nr:ComEC/Rec2 family competence protein [Allomuricauda aequoris]RIV70896.1 ComEC family competence protein [Allomuricauda aequoris]TXK02000.1 ComEC family competence protein [Allomuricauda aequoris]